MLRVASDTATRGGGGNDDDYDDDDDGRDQQQQRQQAGSTFKEQKAQAIADVSLWRQRPRPVRTATSDDRQPRP